MDSKDFKYGLAAVGATFCVQFLHPFDVIKTRMQSHDGHPTDNLVPKYKNLKYAIQTIYRDEGIKGFTKGIMLSLFANSVARSLFFAFYESKKELFGNYFSKNTSILLASIYASWLASFLTQPLWVTNTRLQLNIQKQTGFENIKYTVQQIYSQHGLLGFYRGFKMQLFVSTHGMIQINSYEWILAFLNNYIKDYNAFIAGMASKGFAIYCTYPLTTIKTRIIQNQFQGTEQPKYTSNFDIIKKILKNEGIRGFYKGIPASLVKGVPQKGLYFYCYEYLKTFLKVGRNYDQQ